MRSRFLVELALIAAALWGARCGTREAAGSGSGSVSPDAGYSGADAGASGVPGDGGGGSVDAGTGSNSGNTDGGSDGGTVTGGTSTDAGSAGPSADCTGLPAPADPGGASASHFIWFRDSTGNDGCSGGVVSGTGTLARPNEGAPFSNPPFLSSAGNLLAPHSGGAAPA